MLPPLLNARNAEEEIKLLRERPTLQSSVSSVYLDELKDRFQCSDIYPRVRLDLVREQDRRNPKRVELAQAVAQKMAVSLLENYSGEENSSKLILLISISVVSNGRYSPTSRKKGLAKLTACYCIFRRDSGAVAVSKQLGLIEKSMSPTRNIDSGQRNTKSLFALEEQLTRDINKEVTFTCCSRIPSWGQVSSKILQVKETESSDDNASSSGGSNKRLILRTSMSTTTFYRSMSSRVQLFASASLCMSSRNVLGEKIHSTRGRKNKFVLIRARKSM